MEFADAVTGPVSEKQRIRIARHLLTCSDCAQEYRLVRSFEPLRDQAEQVLSAPTTDQTIRAASNLVPPFRWLRRLRDSASVLWQQLVWWEGARQLALTVAILIAVATSFAVWQSTTRQAPTESSERAQISSKLSVNPPDGATLAESPARLSWSPFAEAATYRVVLYDYQSTPIWESNRSREMSVVIPESVRQGLRANQPYYWRVVAEETIAQRQSELFQFTVISERR
jgi:hypothetical protein